MIPGRSRQGPGARGGFGRAIGQSDGGPEVRFGVHVRNDNRDHTPPLARLKAQCGPGDAGEPVITVLLPDEGASCHDVG